MSEAFERARNGLMQVGEQRRAYRADQETRATNQAAGNALQAGDYGAASNALFAGGNLQGGMAVQSAQRGAQTADREQQRSAIAAAVTGLLHVPEAERGAMLQSRIAPLFQQLGMGEYLSQITPQDLTDQSLRGLAASMGGETQNAPSGYRWGQGGRQEFIPGGPEDPANQRPIVTPYGIMMPPGAALPDTGGQGASQGQPQSLGSTIPPGWSAAPPRPNQPSSARPAAGGGERGQPVSVSFQSSRDAQAAITSLVPGVRVTSGARSQADNRRVGGADGSFHLQDRARDLVPPAGMSMAQLAGKMRQAGFRVLDEGDHVHVSW